MHVGGGILGGKFTTLEGTYTFSFALHLRFRPIHSFTANFQNTSQEFLVVGSEIVSGRSGNIFYGSC